MIVVVGAGTALEEERKKEEWDECIICGNLTRPSLKFVKINASP